ncbi:MAG TPA: amidohydrolase family protein [Burkholderiales bacterium]|nr:amidohydrolase family protein [Burkholderiales bacterium]
MITRRDSQQPTQAVPPPIVFTSCELQDAAHEHARLAAAAGGAAAGATQATAGRREVKVNGKRVRTIDIHCHCVIPETLKLSGQSREQRGPGIEEVGERRIREMDEMGIDVGVLSINPYWYKTDRDTAAEIIRINNERLAEFSAKYPDRITAFASVSLQFPELAAEQLEHAVKKLGLQGPAVGASCAGKDFSDPMFHPFWRKCEDLGVLTFIHPQSTPELHKRLAGNGWLANTIGNPLDTTICLSKLIFEGTLDRFPNLKLCSAHGGGYLPSYAPRSDHACRVGPDQCNPEIKLKKKPTEYLRTMYFDTLVFTSEALRHLAAEVGVSQLMIGTDHPIPWNPNPVDHVMNAEGFTDEERIAMLGGNAAKLLKLR